MRPERYRGEVRVEAESIDAGAERTREDKDKGKDEKKFDECGCGRGWRANIHDDIDA